MGLLSRLVTALGLLMLVHAGFSASHFRDILVDVDPVQALGQEVPPLDVKVEALLGFVVVALGTVMGTKPFQPIALSGKTAQETVDVAEFQADFVSLNSRAKAITARKTLLTAD